MTIKSKLIVATLAIVASTAINFITTSYSEHKLESYAIAEENLQKVKIDILELRKHEKDFLSRKDLKYVDKFNKTISHLKKDIQHEEEFLNNEGLFIYEIL